MTISIFTTVIDFIFILAIPAIVCFACSILLALPSWYKAVVKPTYAFFWESWCEHTLKETMKEIEQEKDPTYKKSKVLIYAYLFLMLTIATMLLYCNKPV